MIVGGFLFAAALMCVIIPIQRNWVEKDAMAQGDALAEAVYGMYQTVDSRSEIEAASNWLLRVAKVPDVAYVAVLDSNGQVFYSNKKSLIGQQLELKQLARYRGDFLLINHFVSGSSSEIAGVQVAIDMGAIFHDLNVMHFQLAIAMLVLVFLLTVLVGWLMERMIGRRLVRLVDAMGNAQRGSFLVRAQVDQLDEVGRAAKGFNTMLAALTNMQVREIEREQDYKDVVEKLSIKEKFEKVATRLTKTNEDLGRRIQAQELLMEGAHRFGGTLSQAEIVEQLAALLKQKLPWQDFAIFLAHHDDDSQQRLHLARANGAPDLEIIRNLDFEFGEGITGLVAETGESIIVSDLNAESRIKLREHVGQPGSLPNFLYNGSMMAIPMLYQGQVTGVLDFFAGYVDAFDEEELELLKALGAQAAMAIVNAKLYEKTLMLATSDALTGLDNRRSMEKRIEGEIARSQRFEKPLSLLMIDVDHFKDYNDRMGHVLGDSALKKMAQELRTHLRKVDGLARFGGEEFCAILPETDKSAAKEVAAKLRDLVAGIELPGSNGQPLGHMSVSIGIAVYPDDMPSVIERTASTELVHAADESLYRAKSLGRNAVFSIE